MKDNQTRVQASRVKWREANAHKINAATARRYASKLRATPSWAEEFIILEAYELALLRSGTTGIVHHVDHIVPLQSRVVCGLHCEFNLQVIPGDENQVKSNRYWPDMP